MRNPVTIRLIPDNVRERRLNEHTYGQCTSKINCLEVPDPHILYITYHAVVHDYCRNQIFSRGFAFIMLNYNLTQLYLIWERSLSPHPPYEFPHFSNRT